jgi:hypothetical protein
MRLGHLTQCVFGRAPEGWHYLVGLLLELGTLKVLKKRARYCAVCTAAVRAVALGPDFGPTAIVKLRVSVEKVSTDLDCYFSAEISIGMDIVSSSRSSLLY